MSMGLDLNFDDFENSMENLGATFRAEGMSVAYDKLRVDGHNVELKVRYEDLEVGKRIGQGACSMVNRARHKITGEMYAVKLFNIYDKGQRSQMLKEIAMLLEIDCPSLIKLQGVFHSDGNIGLILEYMNVGSLDGSLFTKFIKSVRSATSAANSLAAAQGGAAASSHFSPQMGGSSHGHAKVPTLQIPGSYNPNASTGSKGVNHLELVLACITYQVLWGLAYLHYEHNTHRDIKPGNILINYDGEVKLSDFGISTTLDNTVGMSNTAVGTCKYMSPERLEGLAYNETADIYAFGIVMLEIINNNCYPFGKGAGGGSAGGSCASGHCGDAEVDDGGILSPIELLAEFETLSVNKLLDSYILPNINATGGNICITSQLREFITGMMQYESNDRSSALELLNSSKLFKMYGITDLETAQSILAGYITQHIPIDNLSVATPNTARSKLLAHLPPGNYTNYGASGGAADTNTHHHKKRSSDGPLSPGDENRPTPRNNFNEYDQQNASMQRGGARNLHSNGTNNNSYVGSGSSDDGDGYYDDDQFYEEDFESNQLSESIASMSVQSSLTSPYASRQNSHAAVARERNAKMKRELSNQSADGYNDYNDDDEFGGSGHEERSKCRSSGSGSGGSSSSERRNPKATRQYSDADSPYDSKSNRK